MQIDAYKIRKRRKKKFLFMTGEISGLTAVCMNVNCIVVSCAVQSGKVMDVSEVLTAFIIRAP
jgi:hypothetical protein